MKKALGLFSSLIILINILYLLIYTNAQLRDNRFSYLLIFICSFVLIYVFYIRKKEK